MTVKEYNRKETQKIDNYIKRNNIPLDAGGGMETPGFYVREFQVGGPLNYQLILTRRTLKKKVTFSLEGDDDKINELEKLSGIN